MRVMGMSVEALDCVAWNQLETSNPRCPVGDVPRTLRLLASAGPQAAEEDYEPLYSLVTWEGRETPSAAAAALPFVIALALDPDMGARVPLVDLLVAMQAPALSGEDWTAARALLADPEQEVRRAALPLAAGLAQLLERWRAETDPRVRIPLLLALGEAASGEGRAGETGEVQAAAREALTHALSGDDPVLWLAAVHACAGFDRELPARYMDRLIEVLGDPTLRPRFEEVWYTPSVADAWTREDLVWSTARKLAHVPDAELSFTVRLLETADRTEDTVLCRVALDLAWRLLTERRSVEAPLLPLAGGLLNHPDGAVRMRAANILAALGPGAAPYADRLAALLDDTEADEFFDGTVAEISRWALSRIGDPRALPGLIEQLCAQEEEQGRAWVTGDPRRPEVKDVLIPLRACADELLPAMREAIRQGGARGGATREFLEVFAAWGEDALPALPDLLPLLDDTFSSMHVIWVLQALGPAAASAEPALRTCKVLDYPANHRAVAATAARISQDRAAALRTLGDAVLTAEEPGYGQIGALADFGVDAAPYAEAVRLAMENATHWPRLTAAVALWSITGQAEPSLRVLEEFVLPVADGGDGYHFLREALHALIRMGGMSPALRAALVTIQQSDRRLSTDEGYPMILRDQELRVLIEQALARTVPGPLHERDWSGRQGSTVVAGGLAEGGGGDAAPPADGSTKREM